MEMAVEESDFRRFLIGALALLILQSNGAADRQTGPSSNMVEAL